jgi:hypothetical protein
MNEKHAEIHWATDSGTMVTSTETKQLRSPRGFAALFGCDERHSVDTMRWIAQDVDLESRVVSVALSATAILGWAALTNWPMEAAWIARRLFGRDIRAESPESNTFVQLASFVSRELMQLWRNRNRIWRT